MGAPSRIAAHHHRTDNDGTVFCAEKEMNHIPPKIPARRFEQTKKKIDARESSLTLYTPLLLLRSPLLPPLPPIALTAPQLSTS